MTDEDFETKYAHTWTPRCVGFLKFFPFIYIVLFCFIILVQLARLAIQSLEWLSWGEWFKSALFYTKYPLFPSKTAYLEYYAYSTILALFPSKTASLAEITTASEVPNLSSSEYYFSSSDNELEKYPNFSRSDTQWTREVPEILTFRYRTNFSRLNERSIYHCSAAFYGHVAILAVS